MGVDGYFDYTACIHACSTDQRLLPRLDEQRIYLQSLSGGSRDGYAGCLLLRAWVLDRLHYWIIYRQGRPIIHNNSGQYCTFVHSSVLVASTCSEGMGSRQLILVSLLMRTLSRPNETPVRCRRLARTPQESMQVEGNVMS